MSTQTILEIDHPSVAASLSPTFGSFEIMLHNRPRREVRSHDVIMLAILEACRTPTVQHWIMVKARLGYDTFRKHMNQLISLGMMNTLDEGNKTLYSLSERGLSLLQQLSAE
ncbi:MAG TPA: winged helix-turn-helix domain-containing protein [Nitrososphaerales archaeon]|nr:winged helix-turn-helix domain-containing protein [Nitrososphaerales archaeon]